MARASPKVSPPRQPWVATLLFMTFANPADTARTYQNQINAAWRGAELQQQVGQAGTGQRSKASDAQFLIQATFGPTSEGLQELGGTSYEEWIGRQMALPAELHRSYFRERANPRQYAPMPVGSVRSRCAAGSRWNRFAIERADRNTQLDVRNGQVWVNGELRTEIDPNVVGNGLQPAGRCSNVPLAAWRTASGGLTRNCTSVSSGECSSSTFVQQGACVESCFNIAMPLDDADCSAAWVNLTYDGFVCDAVDAVGGLVWLSSERNCAGTRRMLRNPAVWLAQPQNSTNPQRRFRGVRPGVLLLSESSAECDLPNVVQVQTCDAGAAGTCQPGQFARHSPRLELLRNTPEAPAASLGAAATVCSTVRRNPFNIGSCRVQPACTPGWYPAANVPLTLANLRRLSTLSSRLVCTVAGLRATQPPCRQRSRWVALDCAAANATLCTASALSAAQTQAVQAALQAASGSLRDITAVCDDVPAGVVVQLGGIFFQQVHSEEGNIYDFTDWARRDRASAAGILGFVEGNVLRFPVAFDPAGWAAMSAQLTPALLGRLGDTVELTALPVGLQLPAIADAFQSKASPVYYEVCGSPGEVANDPSLGYWYTFAARHTATLPFVDGDHELPNLGNHRYMSKVNVWFQKAMYGKDQLRQRMAWALSQIFALGDHATEGKLAFYDIFVRNAFGNFYDVLREVTYSPMMGEYLTYWSNKAFHVQGTFPDENYAREVMQLFTIGLWQLHPNGTRQRDLNGEALPTYNNLHIQNFARVFTGFEAEGLRGNVEHYQWVNWVDPMRMRADWHDRFPKTDFGNGYLGDGCPLCADLPADAFLRQGARFELAGFQPPSPSREIFAVNASSPLHRALCQPSTPEAPASAPCAFQAVVELQRAVACAGEQCAWELPRFLLVGGGYYEFAPPPCVRLFFFNGRQLVENGQRSNCADPQTVAGGVACCSNQSSLYPTRCVDGNRDVRLNTSQARCASLNMSVCGLPAAGQRLATCPGRLWSTQACSLSVAIDADGLVSPQTDDASKSARFPVQWADGFPVPSVKACADVGCIFANDACICEALVETVAAFDRLPSEAEVGSLRVGAFPPTAQCFVCSGPVRAYSASGRFDNGTIFEAGGRFWRNLRSTVRVGRRHAFRNPPNFMVPSAPRTRDALNEVEALLDLLFRHPSTPVFTSYRLIQRFGNSNPSARYLEDVAFAFRTGTYGGRTYSGRYGDLGATLAAILLHPEARANGPEHAGALREPVLKLAHLLRSLEYRDRFGRPILLDQRLDYTGQQPLMSPSVFNFYHFDFQPTAFLVNESLREWVAPEYEIMDASRLATQINGLVSAVLNTGPSQCDSGFGAATSGVSLSALPSRVALCQHGDFLAMGRLNASAADMALNELSLLLTGGRLSRWSLDSVRASYQADFRGPYNDTRLGSMLPGSAPYRSLSDALAAALKNNATGGVTRSLEGRFTLRTTGSSPQAFLGEVSWLKTATATAKMAAAQAAIVLTPEFNTVGGRVDTRPAPPTTTTSAPTTAGPRPYKAVVQLFLFGGADTFQLLVPQNCPLYDEYVSVRRNIALEPSQLHQVTTPSQACQSFGIHNKLPFLAQLYRSGEAAFASNVGNLAEPLLSKQEFVTGSKKRCVGVFSHFDQTQAAQTLFCQSRTAVHLGAGGRLADTLATGPLRYRTASFNLDGNQVWTDAYRVKRRSVGSIMAVTPLVDADGLRSVVANVTDRAYEGIYGDIYARALSETVQQTEEMKSALNAVRLQTNFPQATQLQRQLYQVVRLIASRTERQAERDLFFVYIGGFDTHKTVNSALDRLFSDIDSALQATVAELKAQGVWNSTALVTASDFGRTLTPNDPGLDAGTDHAYAGNHLIMGGGIRGSRVFNDFPSTLQLGSAMDVGRGRLIPKYPYESFMVPVAQWMGLEEEGQLASAFPNLANFNRSSHIVAKEALFRA